MTDVPGSLDAIIAPLDRSATSIESAFLQAGDRLSGGLAMFDQLGGSLTALTGELDAGGVTEAATALDALSHELVRISRTLPEDAETLQSLVRGNETIAKHLEALLERMRMMTIIARSFRIEASQFSDASALESFTQDIAKLIKTAQNEISGCAGDHAKMTGYLREVAKAQVALDRDYRDKLLVLADDLSRTFSILQDRRRGGSVLMRDVADRSARISQAAGMAMVSLQAGDSTRQRLEHIAEAVTVAASLRGGTGGPAADVPAQAWPGTSSALCRLQAAQVTDAVDGFADDISRIDEALASLIRDAHELADEGQATYGSGAAGRDSFLAEFRAGLSRATGLLRTCEAARHHVDGATADLRAMLEGLNATITKLNMTGRELFLVGVNAGLKANRLGSESRSLLVIADELKRLAQDIAKDAAALIEVFSEVQPTASRLDRREEAGHEARGLDADQQIVAIVAALDVGDRKIAAFLADLTGKLALFDTDLTRARRDFTAAVAMNDDLLGAADQLLAIADELAPDIDLDEAFGYVDALMHPKYTMAREREVHTQVCGAAAGTGAEAEVAEDDWEFGEASAA